MGFLVGDRELDLTVQKEARISSLRGFLRLPNPVEATGAASVNGARTCNEPVSQLRNSDLREVVS